MTKKIKQETSTRQKGDPHKLLALIEKALDQEKLTDVITINLNGKTPIADYMIVASGVSGRQVAATARKICDKLSTEGVKTRVEGLSGGDWVIVDAGDVIIHLFRPEVRTFYSLEKLWATDFSNVGHNLYTTK